MAYTTINKSTDYFNTKLYTGNGGTQSVTGVGFQPDWVWLKSRSVADSPILFDAVRGVTKRIMSNSTGIETTEAQEVQSFDSDGFTVGNSDNANRSGATMVAWNWLGANGTASNTSGSITSTVSANTTAGFSIVSYTSTGSNATIGHGLGVAPAMIIFKRRSGDTENWVVYHKSLGATKSVILNGSDAQATSSARFQDTSPTPTLFSVGTSGDVNGGSSPFIAYCFAEKQGFSKFGSYVGNGNADGTFVYTGFKPAFVIVKRTDSSSNGNWTMHDNKRSSSDGFNHVDKTLYPNQSYSEDTSTARGMDLLSNGFKFTGTDEGNTSGATHIFMAFAEAPLVGSNNVPCTAR
jgi:hypothetical protein